MTSNNKQNIILIKKADKKISSPVKKNPTYKANMEDQMINELSNNIVAKIQEKLKDIKITNTPAPLTGINQLTTQNAENNNMQLDDNLKKKNVAITRRVKNNKVPYEFDDNSMLEAINYQEGNLLKEQLVDISGFKKIYSAVQEEPTFENPTAKTIKNVTSGKTKKSESGQKRTVPMNNNEISQLGDNIYVNQAGIELLNAIKIICNKAEITSGDILTNRWQILTILTEMLKGDVSDDQWKKAYCSILLIKKQLCSIITLKDYLRINENMINYTLTHHPSRVKQLRKLFKIPAFTESIELEEELSDEMLASKTLEQDLDKLIAEKYEIMKLDKKESLLGGEEESAKKQIDAHIKMTGIKVNYGAYKYMVLAVIMGIMYAGTPPIYTNGTAAEFRYAKINNTDFVIEDYIFDTLYTLEKSTEFKRVKTLVNGIFRFYKDLQKIYFQIYGLPLSIEEIERVLTIVFKEVKDIDGYHLKQYLDLVKGIDRKIDYYNRIPPCPYIQTNNCIYFFGSENKTCIAHNRTIVDAEVEEYCVRGKYDDIDFIEAIPQDTFVSNVVLNGMGMFITIILGMIILANLAMNITVVVYAVRTNKRTKILSQFRIEKDDNE